MSELDYHVITTHDVEHVMTVVDGVVVIVPPAESKAIDSELDARTEHYPTAASNNP